MFFLSIHKILSPLSNTSTKPFIKITVLGLGLGELFHLQYILQNGFLTEVELWELAEFL